MSATTDSTAGERCPDCGHDERLHYALAHVGCHDLACGCTRVPTPDAGGVEALAETLCEAAHPMLRRESCIADRAAVSCPDCRTQAEAVAPLLAAARREGGAKALTEAAAALRPEDWVNASWLRSRAARIARETR